MTAETEALNEITFHIKRGPWDSRKRQLIINNDFLQFEDKDLAADRFTRFYKSEIVAYRYGINWISGYAFTIGREYQIFIKNLSNEVVKINFKSFYGINKIAYSNLCSDITGALWKFYFCHITADLLNKFFNGDNIEIGKVKISQDGITIPVTNLSAIREKTIPWDKIGAQNYYTYFVIYSTDDAANINHASYYHKDWNTGVLYSVVRTILDDKKLIDD